MNQTHALLRLPDVMALTGLPKSSLYRMVGSGTFPQMVKLAARSVAWRMSDVMGWVESRQSPPLKKVTGIVCQ